MGGAYTSAVPRLLRALPVLLLLVDLGAARAEKPCGTYLLVEDSNGKKPASSSTITLSFEGGRAKLTATMPKKEVRDRARYQLHSGSRMSIRFNDMGFGAKKRRYRVRGEELRLPFQVLGGKGGSSTWRRIEACSTGSGADTDSDTGSGADTGSGTGTGSGWYRPMHP